MASITTRVIRNARKRGCKVYTRKAWLCPNLAVYQWRRRFRKHKPMPSDTLWQHITVTRRSNMRADMRTLHRIGMERFGSGVSYNFAVDMLTGEIGLGQSLDAKGTHTVNDKGIPGYSHDQNLVSHAIAFVGMPGAKVTEKAIQSISRLVAALIDEGALTVGHDYNPHSMVAFKDCPTHNVRKVMERINTIGTIEWKEDRRANVS